MSLLCAALAYQLNHLEYETVKENTDLFNEPDWIRESAKQNPIPASNPSPRWNSKKRAKQAKEAKLDVDEKINALLKALDSGDEPAEESKWVGRKVFFCSRTHSQLSQVMGEMSKILKRACDLNVADLHEFVAVTLGSRSNLCINKEVTKLTSTTRMNEKCLELQSGGSEGTCCPYFNEDKKPSMDLLADSIKRLQVADIEDMHSLGNKIGACSYYAARQIQADAHLVTIPYNVLLQKETREAFGVDLTDSIVIIDEAHNLIDAINQMNSVSISVEAIAKSLKALSAYFDRFSRRLSPQHAQLIQQLIQAMSQLVSHGQSIEGNSRISRINDFIHHSKIDNLNIFPIQAYANEAHLSQKISGYHEDGSESRDSNLLNEVIKFIEMLTSSDGDGRVYIRREHDAVSFKYISLSPEGVFADVLEQAHSVILAGGTMAPISDYVDQLFGLQYPRDKIKQFSCDHLIPKENCLAVTLGTGPSGIPFDFSFANRNSSPMIQELGQTILNMINITPDGIVCFFPSYAYMNQVIDEWTKSSVLATMKAKRNVIVESSTLTSVDVLIESYREAVLRLGSKGGILFGVMGGRLSEGINFSDRLARLVIAIGMPFPNLHDPEMAERISHYIRKKEGANPTLNKEQKKSDFLENICMRSVNQTLGTLISYPRLV